MPLHSHYYYYYCYYYYHYYYYHHYYVTPISRLEALFFTFCLHCVSWLILPIIGQIMHLYMQMPLASYDSYRMH